MSHKHPLNTFTPDFKINALTREVVQVQPDVLITLMQYDHNSESLRFECPRFIDGHDMSLCNKVEVHFVNSDVAASVSKGGYYTVTDIAVNSSDPSLVNFTWVVSRNSTENVGTLVFSVRFTCTTGDTIDYVWHTLPFTYVSIDQGLVSELDPSYQEIYLDNLETEAAKKVVEAENATTTALEAAERASEAVNDLYSMDVTDKAPAIVCEASGEVISITDSANMPLKGLKLFGKSTQDGTPTPTAPVEIESVENPSVAVCGKNLFNINAIKSKGSVTNNGNNTLTINKLVSQPVESFKEICPYLKVGDVATFTFKSPAIDETEAHQDLAFIYLTGAKSSWKNGHSKTITQEMLDGYVYFYSTKDADGNGVATVISEIQIELGEIATEYEAYVEAQTLEMSHTLPGIPVTSGGNYTDSEGQQWICDEVDLERGVYVQRVKTIVLDGSSPFNITKNHSGENRWLYCVNALGIDTKVEGRGFCDKLQYNTSAVMNTDGANTVETSGYSMNNAYGVLYINIGYKMGENTVDALRDILAENPITFVCALKKAVETTLSETEIAAYRALHSNYPNTTVLNDAGAHMTVAYAADTKLYIDNKFAELANK